MCHNCKGCHLRRGFRVPESWVLWARWQWQASAWHSQLIFEHLKSFSFQDINCTWGRQTWKPSDQWWWACQKILNLVLVVLVRYVRIIVLIASWEITRNNFCFIVCMKFWTDLYYIVVNIHCQELMKSVGSHCSWSLLLLTMKVLVWYFVMLMKLWLHSILVMFCFGFARCNTAVTSKVFLLSFRCNSSIYPG
jgi:hypothetical protein